MKLKLGLAALLGATVLFARDIIVPASELPRNAQDFISKNFKTAQIALVKKDIDSYDVTLNDGTEIDFIITGEWKDVDGKYKALPNSILPNIMPKISASSSAQIIEVSREINGYKFELSNQLKIYTDAQGNILGQKFDY
ncbi:TPA: PepSY-like domain-containing protein [Campylobacter coli]|nr:PepSY-like domain-containing protein [Campylobacter coli]HEF9894063.1 PepSY-like domain-containing protein [Campylobacter coli]HEF9910099.1 PepSY-like domain-containing protein [Campylobacter coli]HEF9934687.1 PepSY-like domain-containing protein [Campylobacter coli]HEF9943973.1 PepSY-like domain-containing protein [Campylobacter coli]